MTPYSTDDILQALQPLDHPRLLLAPDEASEEVCAMIPDDWWEYVALYLSDEQIETVGTLWQPVYNRLPATMERLWGTLHGLAVLLEEGQPPSLLYIFLDEEGKFIFWRGFPPLRESELPERIQKIWPMLPEGVTDLYGIHDGWMMVFTWSNGHLPISHWSFLSDREWSLEKAVVARMPIPPEQVVVVYGQGGSGYLGFELPAEEDGKATASRFYSNRLTEMEEVEFWDAYDEWTAPSFDEFLIPGDE